MFLSRDLLSCTVPYVINTAVFPSLIIVVIRFNGEIKLGLLSPKLIQDYRYVCFDCRETHFFYLRGQKGSFMWSIGFG